MKKNGQFKSDPLVPIRAQIEGGEVEAGMDALEALLHRGVQDPALYRLLSLGELYSARTAAALEWMDEARRLETPTAENELAFGRLLNGRGFCDAALSCFRYASELEPSSVEAAALTTMTLEKLGRRDDAIECGQRCLELCDAEAQRTALEPVASQRPTRFNPKDRSRNIISFSLFGTNPYYWESAIAAASGGFALFPEWTCRFYCGPEVPQNVCDSLLRLGAQIYRAPEGSKDWSGLFWRFLAFDDPDVDIVLVRDVDSPFTLRERLAVEEWLNSDYPFHVIRDHIHHLEPMMAGLWGGWTKLLPPMGKMIAKHQRRANNRYVDQGFLRLSVWPRLRNSTLAHDRYYRLLVTHPVPSHPTEAQLHIGGGYPKAPKGKLRQEFAPLDEGN